MDRAWKGCELPAGVYVNESNGRKAKINIRFTFRGKQQRELSLPTGELNSSGELTAAGKRMTLASIAEAEKTLTRVMARIKEEEEGGAKFMYGDFFPKSRSQVVPVERSPDTVVMRDLFTLFLEECKVTRGKQTAGKYVQHADAWLRPYWGEKTANLVTRETVMEWLRMVRDGEVKAELKPNKFGRVRRRPGQEQGVNFKVKRSTVKQILVVLRGTIEHAMDHPTYKGLFSADPTAGIKLKKLWPNQRGPKTEGKVYRVIPFSQAEREAIIAVASPAWQRLLTFWWWTGLRIGELAGIKANAINWDKKVVNIGHALTLGEFTDSLKTASSYREVPLIGPAERVMREQLMENAQDAHNHDFVWVHPTTGKPLLKTSSQIYDAWRALLTKANVTYRNIEQCRHTYASHMLHRQEDIGTISKVMGHKDIKITMEVYAKAIEDAAAAHKYAFRNQYHENVI